MRFEPRRVMAMARPCRSAIELALVDAALIEIEARGSARSRAKALADAVAGAAILQLGADEFAVALACGEVRLARPALAALALDPGCFAGEALRDLAIAAFERRGLRHVAEAERSEHDESLRRQLAARLAERFRRRLK